MIKSGYKPINEALSESMQDDLTFPAELKVSTQDGMRGRFYRTIKDIDKTLAAMRKDGWKSVPGQRSSGTGREFIEKDGKYLKVCINLVGSGYRGTNMFPQSLFSRSDWSDLKGEDLYTQVKKPRSSKKIK